MKIFVTGGAGFIGSNFIRYVLNKYPDYKVINFDKLTYAGNLDNLKDIENDPRYAFMQGDICDQGEVLDAIGAGVDAIINFAAESHVDRSIAGASDFILTDVFGTHVLLEIVKNKKIPRYIQISTDEVYGSIAQGSTDENYPLKPNSPYAASKAGGDLQVRSYFKTYKLPVLITRASNNYGPYQYPEKFIPLFVTNALEDKKLPLYGDGKNIRDWLYVLDHCEAIDTVLHKGKEGEIYNIGGGEERQNLEILEIILRETGKGKEIVEHVQDRPGHDRRYSLDCSKIKRELGWQPRHNFGQAMVETVMWYKNNTEWWKKIKEKSVEYKEFERKWYGAKN